MMVAMKIRGEKLQGLKELRKFAVALGLTAWAIGLSYGVMVALQFLVLPVQVRILVRQLASPQERSTLFPADFVH